MKMLWVTSDYDFGALAFEQSKYFDEIANLWEKAINHPNKSIELTLQNPENEEEEEPLRVYVKAFEFGEIDPDFIDFIRNEVQDYDQSKNFEFYIVEEV